MPQRDRRGPYGEGPMTGRGLGYCRGVSSPSGYPPISRTRNGFGQGYGRRQRMYSYPRLIHYHEYTENTPTPQQEKDVLTRQAAWLQSQLDSIQTRLSTIEKAQASAPDSEQED
ncbi:MAG: DUF5320 domain-containing protein [Chloroflexi bacterium]|jgi:hypothetical protein|nr:DUF5320 domain-containing protein [Chloroflexota bacterium]